LDEDGRGRCDLHVLVIDVEMLGKELRKRNLDESRFVPEPMMQLTGNPTTSKRRRS
jgi:hypothetical protein